MKYFIFISKLLVSGTLLFFLYYTAKLDFNLLYNLFISPSLLIVTFSLYFFIIALAAWRWQQLNRAQLINLHYSDSLLPTYIGMAFNNLLPGGVAGDFYRYYYLSSKKSVKKSASMVCVFFDRVLGLMGICVLVVLIAAAYFCGFSNEKYTSVWMGMCLAGGGGPLLVFYLCMKVSPLVSDWLNARKGLGKLLSKLISVLHSIVSYQNSQMAIIKSLLASVLMQILMVLICMACANIMHFPRLSLSDYMLAIAVCQIINLIPIAPGGFGVAEMAFANVLIILNPHVEAKYATIFLAFRIIGVLAYLPSLVLFCFQKDIRWQELRDSPQAI